MELEALLKNIIVCEQDREQVQSQIDTLTAPERAQIAELKEKIEQLDEQMKQKINTPTEEGKKSLNETLNEIETAILENKAQALVDWNESPPQKIEGWKFIKNRRRKFVPLLETEKDLVKYLLNMVEPPVKFKYADKKLCDMVDAGTLPGGFGQVESTYFIAITRPKKEQIWK